MDAQRVGLRGRAWRACLRDVVIAGFVTALTVPLVREAALVVVAPVGAAMLNGLIHGASLVARRIAPLGVFFVLGATALVHIGLGMPVAFLGPAALVSLYTVAALRQRRVSVAALVGASGLLVIGTLVVEASPAGDSLVLYTVLLTVAWWLGDTVRRRQLEAAAHAERAEQLQQARLELAEQAVTQERLRIARELHDVIAHNLTAVSVHAGTARLALDHDAEATRDALATIERTTRATLGELRQLLGVLRGPDRGGQDSPLLPAPRLERLDELAARSAEDGLAVRTTVEGPVSDLPAGLHLTAYRIVQEALTNARRHALATVVTVTVEVLPAEVRIEVLDDGRASPGSTVRPGLGLLGMRERVAVYGGTVDAGPRPRGGWSVVARLPLRPEAA